MTERLAKMIAARLGFTPARVAEALIAAMNAGHTPAAVADQVLTQIPALRPMLQATAGADQFWEFIMDDEPTRRSIHPMVRPQLKKFLFEIADAVRKSAD